MRRPRIILIPIKGGYKWRVRRYTGNPVYDNFEGIEEYPTAVLALEGCAKYMAMWEDVWAKVDTFSRRIKKQLTLVETGLLQYKQRKKHPRICGCAGCIRKVGRKVSKHDLE
jgi:hypothetical protein